jgi:hypothetical protein
MYGGALSIVLDIERVIVRFNFFTGTFRTGRTEPYR